MIARQGAEEPRYATVTSHALSIFNNLRVSGTQWIRFYKVTTNFEVQFSKPAFLCFASLCIFYRYCAVAFACGYTVVV